MLAVPGVLGLSGGLFERELVLGVLTGWRGGEFGLSVARGGTLTGEAGGFRFVDDDRQARAADHSFLGVVQLRRDLLRAGARSGEIPLTYLLFLRECGLDLAAGGFDALHDVVLAGAASAEEASDRAAGDVAAVVLAEVAASLELDGTCVRLRAELCFDWAVDFGEVVELAFSGGQVGLPLVEDGDLRLREADALGECDHAGDVGLVEGVQAGQGVEVDTADGAVV